MGYGGSDIKAESLDKLTDTELYMIYPKDLKEALTDLGNELPVLPKQPEVKQENPPPYRYKRETIGKLADKGGGEGKGDK